MATDETPQPILQVRASEVATRALVVGDPNRVAGVAELLDAGREVGSYREYVTYTGTYRGVDVTVASHGVGAAGAAICFEELARAGVTRIVRAGTCGGLQSDVLAGDLVVGRAAVRDDGWSDRFLPPEWPAVADEALTRNLQPHSADFERTVHTGIVCTAANFYPNPLEDEPRWRRFARAGALAVEMEFGPLLVVAQLHGIAAGGIFAVDGNLVNAAEDMSDYAPERDHVVAAKHDMLEIALDALVADAI